MAYKKIIVDNPLCSRRFHLSYDDEGAKVAETKVTCPFCSEIVFKAVGHPEVTMARQENLVKTAELSEVLMESCSFNDTFPPISDSDSTASEE